MTQLASATRHLLSLVRRDYTRQAPDVMDQCILVERLLDSAMEDRCEVCGDSALAPNDAGM